MLVFRKFSIALILILLAACNRQQEPAPQPSAQSEEAIQPTPAYETYSFSTNESSQYSFLVPRQSGQFNVVSITSVNPTMPSFIAAKALDDAGTILGHTPLIEHYIEAIGISIEGDMPQSMYIAAYQDDGDGTFDPQVDAPIYDQNNQPIQFLLALDGGSAEPSQ